MRESGDPFNYINRATRVQACLSGPEQCCGTDVDKPSEPHAAQTDSPAAGSCCQRRSASHPSDCGNRPCASLMMMLQQQQQQQQVSGQQQVPQPRQCSQPDDLYDVEQLHDHLQNYPLALSEPRPMTRPRTPARTTVGDAAAHGGDATGGSIAGDDRSAVADRGFPAPVHAVSEGERSQHSVGNTGWLDAGSVWSSVQRRGEELQRRQRLQQSEPPPRRQRTWAASAADAADAAAAAANAWRRGPWRRFTQRVRTQLIVTARVGAKDPCTVVIPLALLLCMLGLGLWGVFSVSGATAVGRRQAALNAATDFANTLKSHIAATVAPASTVKTLIGLEPTWSEINKTFHEVAPSLVQKGRDSDAILTIVLAPQGIASAIVPTGLPGWSQVYGLDLLRNQSWRNDALKTVMLHEQGMVMTGPSRLRAGMMGIVCRYAVFIPGAGPEETFGFNGSAYNCTPCYQPPADVTSVGQRFWGFAQLNVDWEVLLYNITRMQDLCERDNLLYNMTYIDPVTFVNRSIATCGTVGPDPVFVHINTMANHWVLAVSDGRGWTPDWLPLVVTVVVVVSLWIAITMAIILINRREHMWLLQAMLPKKVIATLRRGEEYAEAFECVTVLFSDIVSYTTLASEMEPIKVVRLLNEMYSEFDALVDQFECYKVETIGDAFMAVGGTQGEDAVAAAVKVARLAQAMIERTRVLVSADGQKIQIRIGLHSGPVVGAVVGFKMPHFCLCGDTVNTASRMESNSRPMRIHISDSTAALLRSSGEEGFRLESRGVIQVKGKGPMLTHWLLTPEEYNNDEEGRRSGGGGGGGGGTVSVSIGGGAGAGERAAAAAAGSGGGGGDAGPWEVDVTRGGKEADGGELPTLVSASSEPLSLALSPPPIVDAAAEAAADAAAAPWTPGLSMLAAHKSASALLPLAPPSEDEVGGEYGRGGTAVPSMRPSSAVGLTLGTGNARRRYSEACAVRTGSGRIGGGAAAAASPSQPGLGISASGGMHGGVSGAAAAGPVSRVEGGSTSGGAGAVSLTCSFGPAIPKKQRKTVDLRLFKSGGPHSKAK